ncbi:MAG: hypothetical protein HGA22_02895 [Clostridiales bacterium]|nr:hypothetical protein [Clostridiales bacterium]
MKKLICLLCAFFIFLGLFSGCGETEVSVQSKTWEATISATSYPSNSSAANTEHISATAANKTNYVQDSSSKLSANTSKPVQPSAIPGTPTAVPLAAPPVAYNHRTAPSAVINPAATPNTSINAASTATSAASSIFSTPPASSAPSYSPTALTENASYTSETDVALYIHLYKILPPNFITKQEAKKLGWEGGSLEPFAPGKCIGGDHFSNYEKLLPVKKGRSYTECDIDTLGASSRGAKRIVFSNDGLIYYTDDHYASFSLIYGDDGS